MSAPAAADAPLRFCISCEHCRTFRPTPDFTAHRCMVERKLDPVDGQEVGPQCFEMRHVGGACGPEGRLFKPREGAK